MKRLALPLLLSLCLSNSAHGEDLSASGTSYTGATILQGDCDDDEETGNPEEDTAAEDDEYENKYGPEDTGTASSEGGTDGASRAGKGCSTAPSGTKGFLAMLGVLLFRRREP